MRVVGIRRSRRGGGFSPFRSIFCDFRAFSPTFVVVRPVWSVRARVALRGNLGIFCVFVDSQRFFVFCLVLSVFVHQSTFGRFMSIFLGFSIFSLRAAIFHPCVVARIGRAFVLVPQFANKRTCRISSFVFTCVVLLLLCPRVFSLFLHVWLSFSSFELLLFSFLALFLFSCLHFWEYYASQAPSKNFWTLIICHDFFNNVGKV